MPTEPEKLFAPTTAELGRLRDVLRRAVAARWALASLELTAALGDIKRLTISLAVAALVVLVSLPVLVVAICDALAGVWGIDRAGWLLIAFATLIVTASLTGWLGWRRFQRQFVGLEETLETLREDQAWLESLTGKNGRPDKQ